MANPMFEKIIAKKKAEGKEMSPAHEKAKGGVLEDLMGQLGSMGMDKVNGMKKVTVASDSTEGLKKGIKKATDLVESSPKDAREDPESEMSDEGPNPDTTDSDEEYEGSPADEAGYNQEEEAGDQSSDEDKDKEIAKLKMQLAMSKLRN